MSCWGPGVFLGGQPQAAVGPSMASFPSVRDAMVVVPLSVCPGVPVELAERVCRVSVERRWARGAAQAAVSRQRNSFGRWWAFGVGVATEAAVMTLIRLAAVAPAVVATLVVPSPG